MKAAELAISYLDALSDANLEMVLSFLAESVVVDLPMSLTGEPIPMFTFAGREAAMQYFGSIAENFSQVRFKDREAFPVEDGETVFIEAKGELIQRHTGASYRNTYCFKVKITNSKITHVREYTNPIAWAKLMNLKLG